MDGAPFLVFTQKGQLNQFHNQQNLYIAVATIFSSARAIAAICPSRTLIWST